MSKMLATAARDGEASTPTKSDTNIEDFHATTEATTPVKLSKKPKSRTMSEDNSNESTEAMKELLPKNSDSNVEDAIATEANRSGKSPKKPKARTMSEDSNKENTKVVKELDADSLRGRPVSADESPDAAPVKQLRPRARSALKRQLEQEKATSARRVFVEALEKAKDEAEAEALAEAARARRQAKWEAKQEAASLSAKMEEAPNPVAEAEAQADEEAVQLQALVAEAEAAAAALARSKPAHGAATVASSHQLPSKGCVAPTATSLPETDVDEIDLAEWEIV